MANGIKDREKTEEERLQEAEKEAQDKIEEIKASLQEEKKAGEDRRNMELVRAEFGTRPGDVSIDEKVARATDKDMDKFLKTKERIQTRYKRKFELIEDRARIASEARQKEVERLNKKYPVPSGLEQGLAFVTGGLTGALGGTFTREGKARAARKSGITTYDESIERQLDLTDALKKSRATGAGKAVSATGEADAAALADAFLFQKDFTEQEWSLVKPQATAPLLAEFYGKKPSSKTKSNVKWLGNIVKRVKERVVKEEGEMSDLSDKELQGIGKQSYNAFTAKTSYPADLVKKNPPGSRGYMNMQIGAGQQRIDIDAGTDKQIANNKSEGMRLLRKKYLQLGDPLFDPEAFFKGNRGLQERYLSDKGFARMVEDVKTLDEYMAIFDKPFTHNVTIDRTEAGLAKRIAANQTNLGKTGKDDPFPTKEARQVTAEETQKWMQDLSSLKDKQIANMERAKRAVAIFKKMEKDEEDTDDLVWTEQRRLGIGYRDKFREFVRPEADERTVVSVRAAGIEGIKDGIWLDPITMKPEPDKKPWTLYDKIYFEWVPHPRIKNQGFRNVKTDFTPWTLTFREYFPQFVGGEGDIDKLMSYGKTTLERSNVYLPLRDKDLGDKPKPRFEGDVVEPRIDPRDTGEPEDMFHRNPEMISLNQRAEIDRVKAIYQAEAAAAPETLPAIKMKQAEGRVDIGAIARSAMNDKAVFDSIFDKLPTLDAQRRLIAEMKAAGDDEKKIIEIMTRVLRESLKK